MQNERFQFLKTYADTINKIAEADESLAEKLCMKIIRYGIEWIDEDSGNPILEWLFVQIKVMIDKGQEITEKNRINWKKGWRPSMNWENSQKPKHNPNKTQTKPKDNPNITEGQPKITKIENIKYKKENIISLSKDNEVDKSTYWNEDINKCLDLIKQYNNGLIDWTKQNQRRFAKHLINKLNELDSIKDWRFTREQTLEIILKVISQNKYYSGKITSPETIYRNLSLLMNVVKNDISKTNASNVILETL